MQRYSEDYARNRMGMHDFAEQGSGYDDEYRGGSYGYGGRGDYRGYGRGGGMIGGMRSDAGGTRWDRFPGEEGWYGEGYGGYPGGDVRGGALGYGGEYRGRGYDAEPRGGRGGESGFGGRMGSGWRGGYGGVEGGSYGREFGGRAGGGGGMGASGLGGGWRPESGLGGGVGYADDFDQRGRTAGAERIRARDIMTEEPECVTPETTVADVAKKMRELDVGIIPVVENTESRRLRGVVTDRDLAVRVLAAGKDGKAKIAEYMTEQVETVNKNDTVHTVLDVMKREQVRRVPVTDRDGRLVGIIAQADLAVSYAGVDLQRETEVEEAIERISEPARPRR